MQTRIRLVVVMLLASVFLAQQAFAAVVLLPDPIAYAKRFDDFYSYSAKLLTEFGFSGFDGPVGVGGLDIVVATGAGGINNDPVNGGFQFPDPMVTPSGGGAGSDAFDSSWGRSGTFTPVLVDTLLSYLHTNFGPTVNIPVFNFDMSQQGGNPDLNAVGQVQILDSADNVVAFWALDTINNHQYDDTAFIPVLGELTATNPAPPFQTVTVHNNLGSGKNDYIQYAPTMDLSQFAGKGYKFVADFKMNSLNGSHEEVYLTGSIQPTPTPEPATLLLMGLGAAGAAYMRKRKM